MPQWEGGHPQVVAGEQELHADATWDKFLLACWPHRPPRRRPPLLAGRLEPRVRCGLRFGLWALAVALPEAFPGRGLPPAPSSLAVRLQGLCHSSVSPGTGTQAPAPLRGWAN